MRFLRRYSNAGKGWHYETWRHSLAAKGIKTSFVNKYNFQGNQMNDYPQEYPQDYQMKRCPL